MGDNMLEARNLCRSYKTKNGPVVKALDNVSVKFEETGMVFILGKSGSGKSTLLNVLGGLDKYDSGEIIVKGKSSKDFSNADFDSYRNTFIGFIFQEYNILEEFTVNKNIGLALELQGKKADKEAIDALTEQVDLKGYGRRKPNTLSGGQKQRVAIARALVKNPEIIMADEPTGALDSNTGKQVFDTLKKLSKTKLVLVVSHDREFAEYYGDRIIELADGKIISDISKYKSSPKESNGFEIVDDKILTIKKGTKIDSTKTKTLLDFLNKQNDDIVISVDSKANTEFKKFAMIDEEGNKESFKETDNVDVKDYNPKDFKLIRSKLPAKDSFKMGASGLKSKPVRLFFTIILSAIAFALFGLADTMGSYDKVDNTIQSIMDSNINYASFSKEVKQGEGNSSYYDEKKLSLADFDKLNSDLEGYKFLPVFSLNEYGSNAYISEYIYNNEGISDYRGTYRSVLYGFAEINQNNQSVIGTLLEESRLPSSDDEIVITKYTYEIFKKGNFKGSSGTEIEINSISDIIGKEIEPEYNKKFKIVGVIDTNVNLDRYEKMNEEGFGSGISDYMLEREFDDFISKSSHALGYLNSGYYNRNFSKSELDKINNSIYGIISDVEPSTSASGNSYDYISNLKDSVKADIVWLNEEKSTLANDEIVISYSMLSNMDFDPSENTYLGLYDILSLSGKENYVRDSLMTFMDNDSKYDNYSYYEVFTYYNYGADTKWTGDYPEYSEELTDEMKTEIENFINSVDTSMYVDVSTYLNRSEIKSVLESEYQIRYENGDYGDYNNYLSFIISNASSSYYGDLTLTDAEKGIVNGLKRLAVEKIKTLIPNSIYFRYYSPSGEDYYESPRKFTIVGYYIEEIKNSNGGLSYGLISPVIYDEYKQELGGVYNFAISKLDYTNEAEVRKIVEYGYKEGDIMYVLNNPVMSSMSQINSLIETLSSVFLYVGIGFAVFASLLLLNFITISISYKKREIGVLRAIGARGRDVFKIFFSESFIIAIINFVLALIGSFVVCLLLNNMFRNDYGILITLLNMGIRQVLLILGVSLLVAFISSYLPVHRIAKKKPIDAIRNS